jgi:hypothetical protein
VLLLVIAALVAGVILFSRRGDQPKAFAALATTAVAGVAIALLAAFPHVGASMKDMTPFLMQVKPRLADGEPAYVTGRIDETLRGIVPFVLDREMVELETADVYRQRPHCVLVQDKNAGDSAPQLEPPYRLLFDRNFGPGRYFAFWCRQDGN